MTPQPHSTQGVTPIRIYEPRQALMATIDDVARLAGVTSDTAQASARMTPQPPSTQGVTLRRIYEPRQA